MPASDYVKASGVRVHAGQKGRVYPPEGGEFKGGEIWFGRAPVKGIDTHLYALLKIAADELKISIFASSVDTGTHAKSSRHYRGCAVDIAAVGLVDEPLKPARLTNAFALRLAWWFAALGFEPYENGPWPAVLFGPPRSELNRTKLDHRDHIHASLAKPP